MRTKEEILERLNSDESDDLFGTQREDLICLLDYESAIPYLDPVYVKAMADGTCPEDEKWSTIDVRTQIIEYLPFAFDKARERRGLAAGTSLLHFRTWIWFDDEAFYNEILPKIEDYKDYGYSALETISKHYNIEVKKEEDEYPFENVKE